MKNEKFQLDFPETLTVSELTFRHIKEDDYYKDYFELLEFLSVVQKSSFEDFKNQLYIIKSSNSNIYVLEENNKIVASVTVIIEFKFIRNLGKVCHIEDMVIHKDYQNKKYGTKLINLTKEIAKLNNCYKIILDCSEENMGFYIKQGFMKKSCGMALYLNIEKDKS